MDKTECLYSVWQQFQTSRHKICVAIVVSCTRICVHGVATHTSCRVLTFYKISLWDKIKQMKTCSMRVYFLPRCTDTTRLCVFRLVKRKKIYFFIQLNYFQYIFLRLTVESGGGGSNETPHTGCCCSSQYPVIASLHTEFTTHADKLISRPAPCSHITQVRSCQSDFGLCVFFFFFFPSYSGSVEQAVPRLWFGKFCRLLGLGGEKRPVFSLRELKHKLHSRS